MPSSLSIDNCQSADIVDISPNNESRWPDYQAPGVVEGLYESPDHFIHRNGICFAGTHLIVDLWDANQLDDLVLMEQTMREAVTVSAATLLHIHLHHFTPNGGISGVAVLAESHISVHTWPERGYAAFDVFMCGDAMPEKTIDVLKQAFSPKRTNVLTELRGVVPPAVTQSVG